MNETVIGVIGGSGLYEMEGLEDMRRIRVETPFGEPSDEYVTGTLNDVAMVFLPRHGRGHRLLHAPERLQVVRRSGAQYGRQRHASRVQPALRLLRRAGSVPSVGLRAAPAARQSRRMDAVRGSR